MYIGFSSGLPIQETLVQSLSLEDPWETETAMNSNILAREIPWKKKTGRLQSMGLERVGHNLLNQHEHK